MNDKVFNTYLEWFDYHKKDDGQDYRNNKQTGIIAEKKAIFNRLIENQFKAFRFAFENALNNSTDKPAYIMSVEDHILLIMSVQDEYHTDLNYHVETFLSFESESLRILNAIAWDYAAGNKYNYSDIEINNEYTEPPRKNTRLFFYVNFEAILLFRDYFIQYLPKNESFSETETLILPRRSESNKTNLTEIQLVILAYYLRKQKFILSTASNALISRNFGQLTGYDHEKFRQLFSQLTSSNSEINAKNEDIQAVINNLEEMTKMMKKEL
jgi:hypothetical protein